MITLWKMVRFFFVKYSYIYSQGPHRIAFQVAGSLRTRVYSSNGHELSVCGKDNKRANRGGIFSSSV